MNRTNQPFEIIQTGVHAESNIPLFSVVSNTTTFKQNISKQNAERLANKLNSIVAPTIITPATAPVFQSMGNVTPAISNEYTQYEEMEMMLNILHPRQNIVKPNNN